MSKDICLLCLSPISTKEGTVKLRVSMNDLFNENDNYAIFEYYKYPDLLYIDPFYGLNEGGSNINIYGDNFKNYSQLVHCLFGS